MEVSVQESIQPTAFNVIIWACAAVEVTRLAFNVAIRIQVAREIPTE